MQIFKTAWLNSYIGIWLLFQGAANLPTIFQVEDESSTRSTSDAVSAELGGQTTLSSDTLSSAAVVNQPAAVSHTSQLRQPWRLPPIPTSSPLVRVTQTAEAALQPLAYIIPDGGCTYWESPASTTALPYQVLVSEQIVAEFADRDQAHHTGKQIRKGLDDIADPSALKISRAGEAIVGYWRQQRLFEVDSALSQQIGQTPEAIATTWVNALRTALDHAPLSAVDVAADLKQLSPTGPRLAGVASWYGPYFHGRKTANGEIFNQNELTAAHPTLPFNTKLKVTNQLNGRSVMVRVNDRGPYIGRRTLDLSRRAARCLNSEVKGVVPFHATVLQPS
ncbi:MAG: septal ring lytic transglycosylase RlpA family protein [Elainellaceae cyanobacterium]